MTALERRGFNKPPLSFGSVVANDPAPVFTGSPDRPYEQPRLLQRPSLLQIPTPDLEGSVNNNDGPRTEDSRSLSNLCQDTGPTSYFNARTTALGQYGPPETDHMATFETVDDIMAINPYMRRADEIGFSHQVPGIGHLGNSLEPPGWKEGDPPITPDEAARLYYIDRQHVVDRVETTLANQEHQNNEEKERFMTNLNDQFQAWRLLCEKVLEQRLFIYNQHQERLQKNIERLRGNEHGLPYNRLPEASQPVQARAMATHMAASLPQSPCWQGAPTCRDRVDGPYGCPQTSQSEPQAM